MADTTGTLGNAHEPSMEDILASIRRMIADDDVPAVNAQDKSERLSNDAENSSETPAPLQPTALVQAVAAPAAALAVPSAPKAVKMDTDLVFENFDSDFDFEDDLTIPDVALNEDIISAAIPEGDDDLIDIDELIAEVTARSEAEVASVMEDAAALENLDITETPAAVADNTDIELVKSLMADLTEDEPSDGATDAELDQILNEIADIEVEDSFPLDMVADTDVVDAVDDDFNALLQIAQEADADAKAFKLGTGAAVLGGGAAALTVVAREETNAAAVEAELESVVADTIENDTAPIETKYTIEEYNEEIPDMSDAAEDNIIQGEVEQATQSAFASLASVVERKDEVITTGPGIGDLVKEALQPMLKDWLDKNLKGIVERSVAKEIKRISNTK